MAKEGKGGEDGKDYKEAQRNFLGDLHCAEVFTGVNTPYTHFKYVQFLVMSFIP